MAAVAIPEFQIEDKEGLHFCRDWQQAWTRFQDATKLSFDNFGLDFIPSDIENLRLVMVTKAQASDPNDWGPTSLAKLNALCPVFAAEASDSQAKYVVLQLVWNPDYIERKRLEQRAVEGQAESVMDDPEYWVSLIQGVWTSAEFQQLMNANLTRFQC